MTAAATTPTDVQLDVGDTWCFGVTVPSGGTVSVLVTSPTGIVANPTPVALTGGVEVQVPLEEEGRYLAVVTVESTDGDQVIPFTAHAATPTTTAELPTAAQVEAYLSTSGATSAPIATIAEALAAETDAQRRRCDIPPAYPNDLAEALKRRVARNLAARSVPIAQVTTFEGGTSSARVTRYDAEVDRLEGPFRKVVVA